MVDFWNDFLHVAAFFDGNEMTAAVVRPGRDPQVRPRTTTRTCSSRQPAPGAAEATSTRTSPTQGRGQREPGPGEPRALHGRRRRRLHREGRPPGRPAADRPQHPRRQVRLPARAALRRPGARSWASPTRTPTAAGRRGGVGGVLPLPGAAPVHRPVHGAEPGHPVRLGHPAEVAGRRGGQPLPRQQGQDQADADDAAQLAPSSGGRSGQKVRRPDGVPGRHLPHPRRRRRHAGRRSRTTTRNAEPVRCRACGEIQQQAARSSASPRPAMPTPNGYPDVFVGVDLGRHDGQPVERGVHRHHRRPAAMFTYAEPENAARHSPAGDRRAPTWTRWPSGWCNVKLLARRTATCDPRVVGRRDGDARRSTPRSTAPSAPVARAILASPQHHLR